MSGRRVLPCQRSTTSPSTQSRGLRHLQEPPGVRPAEEEAGPHRPASSADPVRPFWLFWHRAYWSSSVCSSLLEIKRRSSGTREAREQVGRRVGEERGGCQGLVSCISFLLGTRLVAHFFTPVASPRRVLPTSFSTLHSQPFTVIGPGCKQHESEMCICRNPGLESTLEIGEEVQGKSRVGRLVVLSRLAIALSYCGFSHIANTFCASFQKTSCPLS